MHYNRIFCYPVKPVNNLPEKICNKFARKKESDKDTNSFQEILKKEMHNRKE